MTEENFKQSPLKDENDPNNLKMLIGNDVNHNGKPKSYQYFDISPKVVKKFKIYHISHSYPVVKPYSNNSEW